MKLYEIVRIFDAKKAGKEFKAKCPAHNDSTPSLSITQGNDGVVMICHAGCDTDSVLASKGLNASDLFESNSTVAISDHQRAVKKKFKMPEYKPVELALDEKVIAWFETRGITDEVLLANKIEYRKVWMPQVEGEVGAICFPYFRDGEVVNVKYRARGKHFKMEKGAELVLYGLDRIQAGEPLYWVEGEVDALSLDVAEYTNRVSVPNGAGGGASKDYERGLSYLASSQVQLESIDRHIIAVDNDIAGRGLQNELIRRLGPEKCFTVAWPKDCKDANDVLMTYGVDILKECLADVQPVPVAGIYSIKDIEDDIVGLYYKPLPGGEYPGTDNLAKFYRPRAGEWTLVTGIPSSGKSRWVGWHVVQLAKSLGWQFAICSPEHQPLQRHAAELISCFNGMPFREGPNERMSAEQLNQGIDWLDKHFSFLLPDDEMTIERILELSRVEVFRRGIKGLVVDPWNEFDHTRPKGMSLTEYVGKTLIKIRQFARRHQVHVWVVAHPQKLQKDKDGEYPVPTPYDVSDSAHWYNKPDMALTVHRDKLDDSKAVDIHIQKVRFEENGHIGVAEMFFNKLNGQYSDEAPGQRFLQYGRDDESN